MDSGSAPLTRLARNDGLLFSAVAVPAARDSLDAFVFDHAFERMPALDRDLLDKLDEIRIGLLSGQMSGEAITHRFALILNDPFLSHGSSTPSGVCVW